MTEAGITSRSSQNGSRFRSMESFKRSLFGYRRSEVDSELSRRALDHETLERNAGAAEARASAMHVEILALREQIDLLRSREAALLRSVEDMRRDRDLVEREARSRAEELVLEAQARAALLKTEGLRQVGELQLQVEQLVGMRTGLTQALQRLAEDIAAAMARIATSPATAIDRPIEHHVERWSADPEP